MLAGLVVGVVTVPVVAVASSMPVSSTSLGAGTNVVQPCGEVSGFTYRSGFSGGRYQITSIDIAVIDPGCQGEPFDLTLYDTTTSAAYVELSGALPSSPSGALTVPPGVGPDLATVPSTVGLSMVITP